jgi:hypothetical protein
MGKDALRVRAEYFTVVSTCDDRFVREVAFYLDQVYRAYRKTFGIHGKARREVTVYLLEDFDEYARFQVARFGGAIQNPAFYYSKDNFIAAYNLFPVEREREIRATILKYEREAREYQKEIKAREDEIRRTAIDIRRDIDKEARRAAAQVRADPYGSKNKRLREIDEWKRRQKGIVRDKERDLKAGLKEYRDKAGEYISKNRRALAHNYRLRLESNKHMFECLFHEGFHAFSRNFLWKHGRQGVPRWLEEGLASYYEMSVVEAGELIHGGAHPFFLDLIGKRSGKLLPLAKVVKGDAREFLVAHKDDTDRSNLYYAQSWALGHYLVGNVPQERILAYARATAAGADPVKEFEKLMGAPIRRVETDIERHLAELQED